MLPFFVSPGFKPSSSDTALMAEKATLDNQAVHNVAGNPATFSGIPIPQADQIRLVEAARTGNRAAFDGIMNNVAPTVKGAARDALYHSVRAGVLGEQQTLYSNACASAIESGDRHASGFWLGHVIRNAREQAGMIPRPSGGGYMDEFELTVHALSGLMNRLPITVIETTLLLPALERGASASAVLRVARDAGIEGNTSSSGSGTVRERLYRTACDRATTLFNEMKTYYGHDDPTSTLEYNRRLHEFRNLV